MSQINGKINDKLGKIVHKIIFISPTKEEGKFLEICQRYFNPKNSEMKVGKHSFPVSAADWTRQSGNRYIQYKDWETCTNYAPYQVNMLAKQEKILEDIGKVNFFVVKTYVKPNGKTLLSIELGANKVADVARSIVAGAALNVGWILAIALLVAGIMGGALLGYFGFPALQGQHMVPNPTPLQVAK